MREIFKNFGRPGGRRRANLAFRVETLRILVRVLCPGPRKADVRRHTVRSGSFLLTPPAAAYQYRSSCPNRNARVLGMW